MSEISRKRALEMAVEAGLDPDALKHSEGVARRADAVCRILRTNNYQADLEKVVIAALLHDIGLTQPHGLDHGKVSADILAKKGLTELAEIVRTHALPQSTNLRSETKILIYADTTTGPNGKAIDPMKKLAFLHRLATEWRNVEERALAREAYEVKRHIVSEVDTLIKQAMAHN